MDQRIINLFDEYTHRPLSREVFLKRLAQLTGSSTTALAVLPLLESNYANAATTSELDDSLVTEDITYPGSTTEMKGYLAKPKTSRKLGSIIVIHENRGLNPHTQDIARRLAKAGFMTLAVDALSPFGGTPANEDDARALFAKLNAEENLQNFLKGFDYLLSRKESNGKTGCIGFCWGGALSNQLAVHSPKLKAAVAYYGRQPNAADVPSIKATVQLHYGSLDERINAGIPAYEEALKKAKIKYELYIYEGAQHAFLNDTSPARYDEASAKLAWERTLKLFNNTLAG